VANGDRIHAVGLGVLVSGFGILVAIDYSQVMLSRVPIPGLFVTGTDTGIGKTLVAAAIADWFRRRGTRVGVCKPLATGCVRRREGLVSEDAEFLAHHADSKFPLNTICPQRFVEPLAPAIAADRAGHRIEWSAIDLALRTMCAESEVMIVEGVGGIMAPVDRKLTGLDMAGWLGLPTVVVAAPWLGTINHTLLTLRALRSEKIPVAGVVINRFPPETPGVAEETNPAAIEKWGKVHVLCLVPEFQDEAIPKLPPEVVTSIDIVDWAGKVRGE
jgi:dethiobiotin synthetase